jgi:hypothetical protein
MTEEEEEEEEEGGGGGGGGGGEEEEWKATNSWTFRQLSIGFCSTACGENPVLKKSVRRVSVESALHRSILQCLLRQIDTGCRFV